MSITATNEGGASFAPIDAGSYSARCYSMVQIGTIKENVLGKDMELNKVRISWELPTELKVFKEENGEQPISISKEFTISMHEKSNLRKFLEGWRGKRFTDDEAKSFDITVLLGKQCMLSIIHKTAKNGGRVYAEISSISALPKGMTCPEQINESFEFSFENFDEKKFNSLPDWLKDKIKTSNEYKKLSAPNHTEAHNRNDSAHDSDLPF